MSLDFDAFTLVLLLDAGAAPLPDDEAAALQDRHLGYLASLQAQGTLLAAGPARSAERPGLRGLSLFGTDRDEALRLAEADPAVMAGRFRLESVDWTVPAAAILPGHGLLPRSLEEVRSGRG